MAAAYTSPGVSTAAGRGPTSRRAWAALVVLVCGYLAIDMVAGASDSPLVPSLPAGVAPPAWLSSLARAVGLDRLSRTGLTIMAILVLAVLVAAFGMLIAEAWKGRVALAPVLWTVALALALAVTAPLLLSRDLYSYAAYGRIYALHGSNPYVHPPSAFPSDPFVLVASPAWVHTRSVYGPVFTLISAAIARTWQGSPQATIVAFKVLAAVAIGAAAVLAGAAGRGLATERLGAAPGRDRSAFAAAAVGLNPALVVHTVGGGHNDALIAAFVAGALVLASRAPSAPGDSPEPVRPDRLAVTGLLALAALVKFVVAPLLVLWILWLARGTGRSRRARAAAWHILLALVIAVASFAWFVDGWHTLGSLAGAASREGWASGPALVARGVRALVRSVGGAGAARAAGTATTAGFLALFGLVVITFLARARPARPTPQWGSTMLLLALAGPYLLPWYVAWFAPLLASMADDVLVLAGLGVSGVLALIGVPAEAGSAPTVWRGMVLAVHYGAAPIMLALLGVVVVRSLPSPIGRRPRRRMARP